MRISFNKIERLLTKNKLLVRNLYVINKQLVYLEVLNIKNSEIFLVYIPSKYEIFINYRNVYNLTYIDELTEDGNIPINYSIEYDNIDMEKSYEEVEISRDYNDNIEKNLEDKYNRPLSLQNANKKDVREVRSIFRQLKRLRFCIKNLKYRLCIIYKYYMCCIKNENDFEGYIINKMDNIIDSKKMIITIDIETFLSNIKIISLDVLDVRNGIYDVLKNNQEKLISKLNKIFPSDNINYTNLTQKLLNIQTEYSVRINELEELLKNIHDKNKHNIDRIKEINDKYKKKNSGPSVKSLYNEAERIRLVEKHENEINEINQLKKELIGNILLLKTNYDNKVLEIDSIVFDNIIMLDTIFSNIKKLDNI